MSDSSAPSRSDSINASRANSTGGADTRYEAYRSGSSVESSMGTPSSSSFQMSLCRVRNLAGRAGMDRRQEGLYRVCGNRLLWPRIHGRQSCWPCSPATRPQCCKRNRPVDGGDYPGREQKPGRNLLHNASGRPPSAIVDAARYSIRLTTATRGRLVWKRGAGKTPPLPAIDARPTNTRPWTPRPGLTLLALAPVSPVS